MEPQWNPELPLAVALPVEIVFLRSVFVAPFFFGKPRDINDGWIRYIRVRWLLDTVSSKRSLSVLLSALGMTCATQTVLALVWWPLSETIRTCVHVPHFLAVATIRGWCLFHSRALDCVVTNWGWRLFEGSVYLKKYGSPFLSTHSMGVRFSISNQLLDMYE